MTRIPPKSRLAKMADALWSIAVRSRWQNKCAVCRGGRVEAHHLVPRQFEETRYELKNGIALCASCHKFDKDLSPHQNAVGWIKWLREHFPQLNEWYNENPRPAFTGTKNTAHYLEVIRSLREHVEPEEFRQVVGKKFAERLDSV